jgi:ribosomal protein S18 acetylase RimI-like enzyme
MRVNSRAADACGRALEFQRVTLELVADRFEPIDQGWVVRSRPMPLVWSANHVRVSRPVTFSEALALAERYLADLRYRQLMIEHEATGERLERTFAEQGWEVDREVVMALSAGPDQGADTEIVVDAEEDAVMGLMRRWVGEDESIELTPDGLDQVVEFTRRAARSRSARMLGVRGEHGTLAAIAMLLSGGTVAQLENVYTAPEERGRGYARALVTRAARLASEADHELVFIVADADDWPQHLYRRIGFEPVGRTWALHRGG